MILKPNPFRCPVSLVWNTKISVHCHLIKIKPKGRQTEHYVLLKQRISGDLSKKSADNFSQFLTEGYQNVYATSDFV